MTSVMDHARTMDAKIGFVLACKFSAASEKWYTVRARWKTYDFELLDHTPHRNQPTSNLRSDGPQRASHKPQASMHDLQNSHRLYLGGRGPHHRMRRCGPSENRQQGLGQARLNLRAR